MYISEMLSVLLSIEKAVLLYKFKKAVLHINSGVKGLINEPVKGNCPMIPRFRDTLCSLFCKGINSLLVPDSKYGPDAVQESSVFILFKKRELSHAPYGGNLWRLLY